MSNDVEEFIRDAELHYDALYERFGKPLEKDHEGEFLAISRTGETVLGPTDVDVIQQAKQRLGTGYFLYRVGQRWVYKLR